VGRIAHAHCWYNHVLTFLRNGHNSPGDFSTLMARRKTVYNSSILKEKLYVMLDCDNHSLVFCLMSLIVQIWRIFRNGVTGKPDIEMRHVLLPKRRGDQYPSGGQPSSSITSCDRPDLGRSRHYESICLKVNTEAMTSLYDGTNILAESRRPQ
jgi:hypothetical protein